MTAYAFGRMSRTVLTTLHPELRRLMTEVLVEQNCTLLRGVRSVEQQKLYVHQGLSKTMDSRHLPGGGYEPQRPEHPDLSYAVDAAPFIQGAVCYRAKEVSFFAGCVWTKALALEIPIRWGGDWDSDRDQAEHPFWDAVHFELLRTEYR